MCSRLFFLTSVLVLIVGTTVAVGGVIVDAEPNDTTGTAIATGLTGLGKAIVLEAEIGNGPAGSADRDLYWFESSVGDQPYLLTVTMLAAESGFDGYLRLFDADGNELVNHDDTGHADLNPLLETYIVNSGRYYIGVSQALNPGYDASDESSGRPSDVGGYGLSIELTQATILPRSLEEDDDAPIVLNSLPAVLTNQFIGDGIHDRLDVDRFQFHVTAPAIVTATVEPSQLRILDPIVNGAYDEKRRDLRVRRIKFAVYETGLTEISVMGTRNAPDATTGRSVGFYNIMIDAVTVASGSIDGPWEPNDSIIHATDAGLSGSGSATFSAIIGDGVYGGTRGDADFYRIEISPSNVLRVDVDTTTQETFFAATVHIYDKWGGRVGSWLPDLSGSVHVDYQPPLSENAQTVFVAVMGVRDRVTRDPFIPNNNPPGIWGSGPDDFRIELESVDGGPGAIGNYSVTFTAVPDLVSDGDPESGTGLEANSAGGWRPALRQSTAEADAMGPPTPARVFASRLSNAPDTIVAIDPTTGNFTAELIPPETPLGGSEGLAFDGTYLCQLGNTGRYPVLYRIDAETGDVVDQLLTWFGSGTYGDIAVLDDTLFVVDMLDDTLFALSTSLDGPVSRLNMGGLNGFSMYGPIAAARSPDRLLVADADSPNIVLELDVETGTPVAFIPLNTKCDCNADLDRDGDVDDSDAAILLECDIGHDYAAILACVFADLNCDGFVRADDILLLDCQHNGPNATPNDGCCSDDLPARSVRATSLAAYSHALLVGDWNQPTLERFDRLGNSIGSLPLVDPVGTMAGEPLNTFGDADGDADADLLDWRWFQVCFAGTVGDVPDDVCATFDYDFDHDIDLVDFTGFVLAAKGESP
jgi:hypothetical protein